MLSQWSENISNSYIEKYGKCFGENLTLRTYTSHLIGKEPSLVLHGGGNTSVKGSWKTVLGNNEPTLFVKGSGINLATIEPNQFSPIDLEYLKKLLTCTDLSDNAMINEYRTHSFDSTAPVASIEAVVHAAIPHQFIDHTHADAILMLTNQPDGEKIIREALGESIAIVNYVPAGFLLGKAVAEALKQKPACTAMVLMNHGLITWGATASESYENTIKLVTKAEEYIARKSTISIKPSLSTSVETAQNRATEFVPLIRGILTSALRAHDGIDDLKLICLPLIDKTTLDFIACKQAAHYIPTAVLTPDHLIRTKALPLFIETISFDDPATFKQVFEQACTVYQQNYKAYFEKHAAASDQKNIAPFDPLPRMIVINGLGALAIGRTLKSAHIVRDILNQTLKAKQSLAAMGAPYQPLSDDHLFTMEYRIQQRAKLNKAMQPLHGTIALVTGAAGAIGFGICKKLLEEGACVAAADISAPNLEALINDFKDDFGDAIMGVVMDVTSVESVAEGFKKIIAQWGGIDLVIVNAGLAHVSTLATMDIEAFRRLQRVNVEGTLLILAETSRRLTAQGCGGDVVLVSTKNVFAPGAQFGAYSATKAAAHQLARIASLELAAHNVRVNMVAPDAVFGQGRFKSGLWATVGPDRMRARGLNEQGLEEYYRSRNLLKAAVTAEHVANAIMYFATRQSPTTGATIPVDGGLPDATPR